ncbi:Bardet-Biedl syndrome 5 protein homolog [Cephus cinctus]|uniref:Bardet-Biedl syndrome 5 protein homolog n=1 Tax=Cephus cinctus TaxID=211228 RepID=A0AAJ7VW63_CEPCN|nr:Bardet-Biedl syndrome 5 protein homolog [Cephus cinctus]XP_024935465.1 Bardet-Biedl syndrome 5 protein homolog [Cephus cinctus]
MWQDNEVRFDVPFSQIQFRVGELLIDRLDMIEDTKGNNGDIGRLLVTNLRIVWHSVSLPRINLSIGYNTFVTATTKIVNSIHGGQTQALHILTSFQNCRYEFIFTNQMPKCSRHYTSVIGVYRAYISSKIYREVKLRVRIIQEGRLILLPQEKVHTKLPGVWNLSTEQGNVGTFIVTNIRLVWFADMNHQFNVSVPYITVASTNIRTSKFGTVLVVTSNEANGGYVLGFRMDSIEKLNFLHKEITALLATYKRSPIFGVEYTFEHQAVTQQPDISEENFKEIQDSNDEISHVFGLYFSDGGQQQREPKFSNYLGLAVEEPKEGSTLQTLWELLPAS